MNETFIRTVPPRPKGYGAIGLLLGLVVTVGFVFAWRAGLPEIQRVNLKDYAKASVLAQIKMPSAGVIHRIVTSKNEYVRDVLRQQVYGGEELLSLIRWPLILGGCCAILFFVLGKGKDQRFMRELRAGRKIDGPELQSRADFNAGIRKEGEAPGVGLMLRNPRTVGEVRRGEEGRVLRIPFRHEPHHFSIAGAPGAGKTQIIIQLIDQVQDRAETDTAVIWDPTGVLTERYYQPERGDVILNPLDARCPSWNPSWELSPTNAMAEAEAKAMGTSLYVGRAATTQDNTTFFSDKSIAIWTQIITHTPPAEAKDLARWMGNEDELDRRLIGSDCSGDINKNSPNMRNGILSSFRAPMQALASIPTSREAPNWTVREWCEERKGWIFLTATPDTADSLRPLQSLWIDMLIRRLMAQREQPTLRNPWFFFDELAALHRLPMLEPAMNQGRKFGLRMVLGFQAMSQVEYLYGKDQAQAILASPGTQTYMRTMESTSAEWMGKQCGAQRLEELVESFPTSWAGNSKGQSVSTKIIERAVFIPSVFLGLPDMHGVLRHGNSLVKIHLPHMARVKRCEAFVPREDIPTVLTDISTPLERWSEAQIEETEQPKPKTEVLKKLSKQDDSVEVGS